MILSIFAFVLALIAIGFLIFIHEFGHYWMAKRVGMRVETFSIGFGSPIYEWKRKNGEHWQIGWLPLGGYVKISGTDKDIQDPYTVPDGFFGKSPWARIKVAFWGPFVNILFAFLCFTLIWAMGGRSTAFKFYNNIIGGVVTSSPMFAEGIRSGDEIVTVNKQPYQDLNSLFLTFLKGDEVTLDIRHPNGEIQAVQIAPPKENETAETKIPLIPFTTAQFVMYEPNRVSAEFPSNPVSGIEQNDILAWFDGALVYSPNQLAGIILDNKALLTVQRNQETFLRRVPRISLSTLKLDSQMREELSDWQYESDLTGTKFSQLTFIPYAINSENVIEFPARFIDKEDTKHYFPTIFNTHADEPLQEGDKIIAVDGTPVHYPYQLLKQLQNKSYLSLMYRDPNLKMPENYPDALTLYKKIHSEEAIVPMLAQIGKGNVKPTDGFVLLQPVDMSAESTDPVLLPTPENLKNTKNQTPYLKKVFELEGLTKSTDIQIAKQRNPFEMMYMSVIETYVPIYLLATGKAKMDMVRGPIGVFEVVAQGLMEGITNALYTLGFISLNLALINLLPFPVLDGGSIVISAFEKLSGRRLTIRTLEKLIIPFALLILFAMIFFTFNDIMRFFKG